LSPHRKKAIEIVRSVYCDASWALRRPLMDKLERAISATAWEPVETCPVNTGTERMVWTWNAHTPDLEPQLMPMDGAWWRQALHDGMTSTPTHWAPLAVPCPPEEKEPEAVKTRVDRGTVQAPVTQTNEVYLFYHYGEHGPEDVKATLDSSRLVQILSSYKDEFNFKIENEVIVLEALINNGLEADRSYSLSNGWGGFCLDLVTLS
jgi:hypothetical protein